MVFIGGSSQLFLMRHSCVRCSNTSCEYFWFLRSSEYSQASNSSLVLKMGIVCGASGRFNLTQVGLHWDAFSFSIVASDSWFNPISRRNHSSFVSGSGFIALSAVGPWPLKTRLPNRLLKAVVFSVAAAVVVALRFTILAQDIIPMSHYTLLYSNVWIIHFISTF